MDSHGKTNVTLTYGKSSLKKLIHVKDSSGACVLCYIVGYVCNILFDSNWFSVCTLDDFFSFRKNHLGLWIVSEKSRGGGRKCLTGQVSLKN